MSNTPHDRAFVRVLDDEIAGNRSDERVIFIDLDNKIREVVYAPEFHNGVLQAVRDRLENYKVLKAVVHVSATVLGTRDGPGPRYSTVEYLPNKETYVRQHIVRPAVWVTQHDIIQVALEATSALFNGEETEDEPDEEKP